MTCINYLRPLKCLGPGTVAHLTPCPAHSSCTRSLCYAKFLEITNTSPNPQPFLSNVFQGGNGGQGEGVVPYYMCWGWNCNSFLGKRLLFKFNTKTASSVVILGTNSHLPPIEIKYHCPSILRLIKSSLYWYFPEINSKIHNHFCSFKVFNLLPNWHTCSNDLSLHSEKISHRISAPQ